MDKDNRERYQCICPICNKIFRACKSILQEDFGMLDMGRIYESKKGGD